MPFWCNFFTRKDF